MINVDENVIDQAISDLAKAEEGAKRVIVTLCTQLNNAIGESCWGKALEIMEALRAAVNVGALVWGTKFDLEQLINPKGDEE